MLNKKELEQLKFFAGKVAQVHGPEHREYIKLNKIIQKIDLDYFENIDFESLRNLTNSYKIPTGACNAQIVLLKLLKKLDTK